MDTLDRVLLSILILGLAAWCVVNTLQIDKLNKTPLGTNSVIKLDENNYLIRLK